MASCCTPAVNKEKGPIKGQGPHRRLVFGKADIPAHDSPCFSLPLFLSRYYNPLLGEPGIKASPGYGSQQAKVISVENVWAASLGNQALSLLTASQTAFLRIFIIGAGETCHRYRRRLACYFFPLSPSFPSVQPDVSKDSRGGGGGDDSERDHYDGH
ncbi:hypothetical protein GGTG_08705 [Gaeumannomyces tritici R3-111a-1]|uniref:Uncharacterized protein n=1 Tax=Gaeumannomyces tritici (strain R3-111a-1) TaxID=644352 RepID=J3P5B6_GAET3|nr:hypothetical protein GGTG_08705 [Gaeumannomyces tritici R3-111a-1]EJT74867.1 hypothetical protein GGTG_08705 [Gaeumannomyces tritici R3-111a-1]